MFALKKCGSKFSAKKWNPNVKTKWKTKQWLHVFEFTNINNLTYYNTLLKEKKRKENKINDANLSHPTNNTHIDINTLAKGNLANTQ